MGDRVSEILANFKAKKKSNPFPVGKKIVSDVQRLQMMGLDVSNRSLNNTTTAEVTTYSDETDSFFENSASRDRLKLLIDARERNKRITQAMGGPFNQFTQRAPSFGAFIEGKIDDLSDEEDTLEMDKLDASDEDVESLEEKLYESDDEEKVEEDKLIMQFSPENKETTIDTVKLFKSDDDATIDAEKPNESNDKKATDEDKLTLSEDEGASDTSVRAKTFTRNAIHFDLSEAIDEENAINISSHSDLENIGNLQLQSPSPSRLPRIALKPNIEETPNIYDRSGIYIRPIEADSPEAVDNRNTIDDSFYLNQGNIDNLRTPSPLQTRTKKAVARHGRAPDNVVRPKRGKMNKNKEIEDTSDTPVQAPIIYQDAVEAEANEQANFDLDVVNIDNPRTPLPPQLRQTRRRSLNFSPVPKALRPSSPKKGKKSHIQRFADRIAGASKTKATVSECSMVEERNNGNVEFILKPPVLIKPETDPPVGLRRSQRTRIPRLRTWMGETPVYEASPSGCGNRLRGSSRVVVRDPRFIKAKTTNPIKLITKETKKHKKV